MSSHSKIVLVFISFSVYFSISEDLLFMLNILTPSDVIPHIH
jgi:hypothetical protein